MSLNQRTCESVGSMARLWLVYTMPWKAKNRRWDCLQVTNQYEEHDTEMSQRSKKSSVRWEHENDDNTGRVTEVEKKTLKFTLGNSTVK
jgi:hypothetical protein